MRFFSGAFVSAKRVLLLVCFCSVMVSAAVFAAPLNVGDEYGGGKVVYLLQPGEKGYEENELHGLIVAKEDLQDELLSWSDAKVAVAGLEIGGNKGWVLPNVKVLIWLYQNKYLVGGFREYSYYWSGSEFDKQRALVVDFYNGDTVISVKSGALLGVRRVRPVRRF